MAPTASSTVSERVTSFVADNKRALLVGAAAVVAVGSVGYYLYSSSSSSTSTASGSAGPAAASPDSIARNEAPTAAKKKSKKKKSAKSKPAAAEGPILEERKAKTASVDTIPDSPADLEPKLTEEAIAALSVAERTSKAADFKSRGNDAYKAKKYELAAELYTRAIDSAARPDAMFFSNRSACYLYFKPPRHDLVVQDCNSALAIDKTYVKPLARRANAHEALGNLQEALNDFTAAVILDRFQTAPNNAALDRVLKALAQQTAAETIKNRTLRLPSTTFITAFFASFRKQKRPALPEEPSEGDKTFQEALDGLEACDYAKAFDRVKSSLDSDSPISDARTRAYALNLRGTFQFLMGDAATAKTSFEESIAAAPKYANSYVKLASVYMDLGDSEGTFKTYEAAIAADPKDPDVYYQRGQVFFIMGDFTLASADYQKSIDLDKDFVFSHIQLAVAQYKLGNIGKSMATFRATMRNFPDMSEPLNYYGELLLDQGKFDEAVQKFEEAIAIENAKPAYAANVLPLVNKGLALFQWKNDIGAAETHCQQALERDPECEAAIATLAQLLLQHSRLREACDMFRRHVAIGRSEMEIQATLNYLLATEAQLHFVTNYPEKADLLSEVAKALQ